MGRLFGSKESNYGLLSAVLHDTQPNFPQVMHPQIRFLEVIGEDLFVFVFEKAIDSHRLVQGGGAFLRWQTASRKSPKSKQVAAMIACLSASAMLAQKLQDK